MRAVVRRATVDDEQVLAVLRLAALAEWDDGRAAVDGARFVVEFAAWAAARRATHVPFVAVSGAEVVGAAWLVLVERVPSPERFDRVCGDIQSVYVKGRVRGQGIGAMLLREVLAEARRRGLEHVTVHSNDAALPLYERIGFEHDPHWLTIVP